MNCTFFGHRDAPNHIKSALKDAILKCINAGVTQFYVGNNGNFDFLAQCLLRQMSKEHSIKYSIALSYINEKAIAGDQEATIFPEGLELVPPRFAISKRNDWLLSCCSVVIAYSSHKPSNSQKWIEKAQKRGLNVIMLK